MTGPSSGWSTSAGQMPPGTLVVLGHVLARRRPEATTGLPWKDDHSHIRYTNDEVDTLVAAGAVVVHPGGQVPPPSETSLSRAIADRDEYRTQRERLRDAVVDLLAAADKVFAAAPDARADLGKARTRGFAALRALPPKEIP